VFKLTVGMEQTDGQTGGPGAMCSVASYGRAA